MDIKETIINVLKNHNAKSETNSIHPSVLLADCADKDLLPKDVEKNLMLLIDEDKIEYDMNDNIDVIKLWLID